MSDFVKVMTAFSPVIHIPASSDHTDLFVAPNEDVAGGMSGEFMVDSDSANWNWHKGVSVDDTTGVTYSSVTFIAVKNTDEETNVEVTMGSIVFIVSPGTLQVFRLKSAKDVTIKSASGDVDVNVFYI